MNEIISLVNSMSPYLLLGFFLAGMMHAFIPGYLFHKYLSKNSFQSVLNAAMLGIPLPLCSCGVIPTGMSLHKEGASNGAVVSFLIATPQTGVDSILATYSLMGLPFAIIRPIAALFTALLGGTFANCLNLQTPNTSTGVESCSCSHTHSDSHGSCSCSSEESTGHLSVWQKFVYGLHYAFVDMMQDIGRWLVLGLIIAGLITVYVPDSFFELFKDNSLASIFLVLLCAIPMYLCSTGSIPIAVALMMKGFSPGTALVLLMAGPAVNMASILVVNKVLGRKTMLVYIASIVCGAILFALGIDYLAPDLFLSSLSTGDVCAHGEISTFNWITSAVLILLLLNALVRRYLIKKEKPVEIAPEENVLVLYVEGMSCNHCRATVEKVISAIEGAEQVEVDLPTGRAVVHGKVEREAVRLAVESIGFNLKD